MDALKAFSRIRSSVSLNRQDVMQVLDQAEEILHRQLVTIQADKHEADQVSGMLQDQQYRIVVLLETNRRIIAYAIDDSGQVVVCPRRRSPLQHCVSSPDV